MLTNAYKALERVKYFCTHDADVREAEAGLDELDSIREQVRALTAERDAFIASLEREAQVADALRARVAELETSAERLRETVRTREAAELEALAEADELRARVAEVEKDLTATQAKFNGAAGACLALGTRATKAESERDAAQQRAKALEVCLARELTKEEAP